MDTSDTSTSTTTTTTTSILSPSARFIIVASLYAAAGAEKAGETSTESSAITAFLQIVAASFLLYKRNPLFRPFKISVCEMIINEWYVPAFVGLAISKAADWLDGFLARKMGINSVVGSYLDPLGDKLGLLGWWYFGMHSSSEELFIKS